MDWLKNASRTLKSIYPGICAVALIALAACGGGGGGFNNDSSSGSGSSGGTTTNITIALSLVSASSGESTSTITSSNPGRVIATVSGISSPVIVTFSTDVGTIPIPTAITDANDQATVDIQAGSTLGAGTITATLDTGETAQLVFAVGATNLQMGSGSPFQSGVAAISAGQISAGGTATVSVSIVDDNGQSFTDPVDVNFSSACSSAATPTATLSSPITTVNGTASSTYLAQGCVGDDTINVTANAGGINLSATALINVLGADAGSIEFVSAVPENISIQGAGGTESSTVKFRVLDTNGNPVNGSVADFSLNTNSGGLNINPVSATSDVNGLVQTVVNAGTVSTPVTVTAVLANTSPAILTQSSQLVVSTGIPDQDSFTLAASVLNPEAWDIAGTEVTVTAFLADGFNNPVPDGTSVSFTTEGGRIDPSCTTIGGQCSVTWNSQSPLPTGADLVSEGAEPSLNNKIFNSDGSANTLSLGQPYGGRATVTAYAIGEESFPDTNGNGRFDASETTAFLGTNLSGLPYDLDEAYTDYNEDGFFNPVENDPNEQPGGDLEELIDFNSDSTWTVADGLYNGVLCSEPAHSGCSSTTKSVHIRRQIVIVMAGSTPYASLYRLNDSVDGFIIRRNDHGTVTYSQDNGPFQAGSQGNSFETLNIYTESTGSASFVFSDLHNQPIPAGSTIKFETNIGTLSGTTTFTVPSTNNNGGVAYGFSLKAPTTTGGGFVSIIVTTPSGLTTQFPGVDVTVSAPPTP